MTRVNGTTNGHVSSSKSPKASGHSPALFRSSYQPLPVAVESDGIQFILNDGKKTIPLVIDAVGGAAVACLGSTHPAVQDAIITQVKKLPYVFNMQLTSPATEDLAEHIIAHSNGAFVQVGFMSGGTEAMEGTIKLARQYFLEKNQPQRKNFISRHISYHGNTLAMLSLSGHVARRQPYETILNHDDFHKVSPAYAKRFQKPDESEEQYVERLRQELENKFIELGPDTVVAFVAETLVGATAGVVPPPKGYFKAMKSVCKKYGALFILDEVMTGMGRMGTMHAWERFGDNEAPDIQAVAKGLGGGYGIIGGVLLSKDVADTIEKGNGYWKHGHTFQAHPLSCAAALAVQQVVASENLIERCRVQGEYLGQLLRDRLKKSSAAPIVFDVRGGGLFWGIEFELGPNVNMGGKAFGPTVQAKCMNNGMIILSGSGGASLDGTKGEHCILSPAYNVTKEEIDQIVDIFVNSVEQVLEEHRA